MEERENEVMEEMDVIELPEEEESRSGLNTGLAMLIGGALALGAGVAVKKVVKIVKNRKAAKKLVTVDDIDEIDDDFEDSEIEE